MKKQKGFTMIELVVVIVILGILAAVAIPKYLDLSNKAKQAVCDANVGAINSALALQYATNAANGAAAYPDEITGNMFADQAVPVCPFGVTYDYVPSVNTKLAYHTAGEHGY
ncbi:MAG: prepilin-type N-terminal cleavage/methylation domain-containing protein [Candidatus Margulisiibacteriota bacterium]|jgi:MSHA pilin protein MshA